MENGGRNRIYGDALRHFFLPVVDISTKGGVRLSRMPPFLVG